MITMSNYRKTSCSEETLALITHALWHRCSEVRTDMPLFGVASLSLDLALADLQSGVVQSVPGLWQSNEGR